MKSGTQNKLKLLAFCTLVLGSTTLLFNNCSGQFQTVSFSDNLASSETSTNPNDPTPSPADPGPSTGTPNPVQPAPAPIQPISMTDKPSWMQGKSLNEWIEIPNTSGAGGAAIGAFSGFALRESKSELIIGAAGGHLDSSDNRVVSLVLETNQPQWQLRIAASPYPEIDVSHYKDGTPSSRHTYHHTFYVESLKRLFLFGNRGAYGNAHFFPDVDAFSLETNQWDPPGTWAPLTSDSGFSAVKLSGSDDVFTSNLQKWSASDALKNYQAGNSTSATVWSKPITTRTKTPIRWPVAHNNSRNELFSLQWADGMGYSTLGIFASRVDLARGVQTEITFKPGPVVDLFTAEKPTYAAMDYDPENDQFLFYSGQGKAAGRVYVIKPQDGNEWEMSLLATIPGSPMPPATPSSGVNSNFLYVPRLKGFVLLPNQKANLFFIKTAQ